MCFQALLKPLKDYLDSGKLDEVIFAIQKLSNERKKQIVDQVINAGVRVSNIPPAQQWINGELSVRQIREVRI